MSSTSVAADAVSSFDKITFRPEAGLSRFEPPEWERQLGDLLAEGAPA